MTTQHHPSFEDLSDSELLLEIKRLAHGERAATALLIRCLAEVDARRLYLSQGCPSLFVYCTRVLHLSEHAAYGRIEAARAARKFPRILRLLEEGAITLTTVTLLGPHLTPENHASTLESAHHRNKREVEELVARLRPVPDVPTVLRKLPGANRGTTTDAPSSVTPGTAIHCPAASPCLPSEGSSSPSPSRPQPPAVVKPLSPERYKLQVTLERESYERLQRARDLMRHAVPTGDLSEILDRAVRALLKELERRKYAAVQGCRPSSKRVQNHVRTIPAAVRREVWERDKGSCAFVGSEGRCGEAGFLEFHHVVPFAEGGAATVENMQLRCRARNAYEAEQWFSVIREPKPQFAVAERLGPGPSRDIQVN